MAITSYPFDNQDTTETQFSWLFRELQDSGVIDSIGGPGLAVSADASGMNVKIAIGRAIVRGFVMNNDAVYTQAIAAANTQPRIDLVVLRLDPTANTIVPAVLQGAAAASPIAPTPTQTDTGTYELVIGQVNVAANAPNIGPADVADKRPFVSSRVGAWTTALRPASPRKYQLGFNTTIGAWEYHNGTAWTGIPTHRGSGTAFPANPTEGDTFRRTDWANETRRWDGAAWKPVSFDAGADSYFKVQLAANEANNAHAANFSSQPVPFSVLTPTTPPSLFTFDPTTKLVTVTRDCVLSITMGVGMDVTAGGGGTYSNTLFQRTAGVDTGWPGEFNAGVPAAFQRWLTVWTRPCKAGDQFFAQVSFTNTWGFRASTYLEFQRIG